MNNPLFPRNERQRSDEKIVIMRSLSDMAVESFANLHRCMVEKASDDLAVVLDVPKVVERPASQTERVATGNQERPLQVATRQAGNTEAIRREIEALHQAGHDGQIAA